MDPVESLRIHTESWGKCRTCRYWPSETRLDSEVVACTSPSSANSNIFTTAGESCEWWDSFDGETAAKIIEAQPK